MVKWYSEYLNDEWLNSIDRFVYDRSKNNTPKDIREKGNAWIDDNLPESAKFVGYADILTSLNVLYRLGFEARVPEAEEIRQWLKDNWRDIWNYIIDNPEILLYIPVHTTNILYYAKTLNIITLDEADTEERKFFKIISDLYKGKLDDPTFFHNWLYILTHILIGESWFYTHLIPNYKLNYKWIVDYLNDNHDRIMKLNNDAIAEIGVVYYLCCEMDWVDKFRKRISKEIDSEYGYILGQYGETDLTSSEHTNIL